MTDRQDRPEESAVPDPADAGRVRDLSALDDADAPVYTIGQAAEMLGVPVASLRRLDDAGAVQPGRSAGRQRRYTRRQLYLARRVLALVGDGTPIAAAGRIADLEDQVATLTDRLDRDAPE
jgi:DNA-binding transcriptional MerR regulator